MKNAVITKIFMKNAIIMNAVIMKIFMKIFMKNAIIMKIFMKIVIHNYKCLQINSLRNTQLHFILLVFSRNSKKQCE